MYILLYNNYVIFYFFFPRRLTAHIHLLVPEQIIQKVRNGFK